MSSRETMSDGHAFSLASSTTPDAMVTVYETPAVLSELVGSTVSVAAEKLTWPSPTAMLTVVPVLGVSTMLPVPACTGSLKVSTMLSSSLKPTSPCVGEYAEMVGAMMSAGVVKEYVDPVRPPSVQRNPFQCPSPQHMIMQLWLKTPTHDQFTTTHRAPTC